MIEAHINTTTTLLQSHIDDRLKAAHAMTSQQLREIVGRCEELAMSETWSVRTAAEINQVACETVLEERQGE